MRTRRYSVTAHIGRREHPLFLDVEPPSQMSGMGLDRRLRRSGGGGGQLSLAFYLTRV